MADRDEPEAFYRLRQSALDRLQGRWPKGDTIKLFGRNMGVRASFERDFSLLRDGQSAPRKVAEAFVEYLRKHRGPQWQDATLEGIAVPDPFAARERPQLHDWWDWERIVTSIKEQFIDRRWDMYFTDPPADCLDFARRCMRTVGYHHAEPGDPIDEGDCVRRAEGIMRRTPAEYAAWLLRMHEWHFRTTFQVTTPVAAGGTRPFRQVGGASLLPVTSAAFEAIAGGRLADMDLDESHLCDPSPYLFIHAIAEPDAGCPVPRAEVDKAQSRCIFYQMAYFSRDVRPFRPSVVTFGGTAKLEARLGRMGFRPTGNLLRATDKPVMVLQPGSAWPDPSHYVRYKTFRFILELFRGLNQKDWRAEDRMWG